MKFNHTILVLVVILLIGKTPVHACTCVKNPKWTVKDWLNKTDIIIKGRVVSVAVYKDSDFPWHYKLFKFVVEKKYKASFTVSDTISIVTGEDGSSCGYAFKIGKEYIVYGGVHKQTNTSANLQLDNSGNKPIESPHNMLFETDICTPTKESNKRELAILKRLTR